MKQSLKLMLKFGNQLFSLFCFGALYVKDGPFRYRFGLQGKRGRDCVVLANGPSLKEALPQLLGEKETDFIVLNYFATCPEFFILKPTHYCLADPMFFRKNHNYENVRALFSILEEKVDWEMNIYVPHSSRKAFIGFAGFTNPHLHIVPVNKGGESIRYPHWRNLIYKKGLACPRIQTVAVLAIFVGINLGYDKIFLYGVDHTFFNGLCVNSQNQVCMQEVHFYETEPTLKPLLRNSDSEPWKMSDYVAAISQMFRSHDQLADYAVSVGTEIWNCTECSMIDSYPRLKKEV